MIRLNKLFALAILSLLVVRQINAALAEEFLSDAQIANLPPTELAVAVAKWLTSITRQTPNGPMNFDSATPNGTTVDIVFIVKSPAVWAEGKRGFQNTKQKLTMAFCNSNKLAIINRGVGFHEIFKLADNAETLEITIDTAACSAPAVANANKAAVLASLAVNLAATANHLRLGEMMPLIKFGGATAHDNVVEVKSIIADAQGAAIIKAGAQQFSAKSKEMLCQDKDDLEKGIVFRQLVTGPDGAVLMDTTVDKSSCE